MARRVILAVGSVQFVFTIIACLVLSSPQKQISLVLGSVLMMINFVLLVYLWKLIFRSAKKSVAMPVFLIVIKYAILVFVFMQISKGKSFNEKSLETFEFALGVLLNPAAVIGAGFGHKFFRKKFGW